MAEMAYEQCKAQKYRDCHQAQQQGLPVLVEMEGYAQQEDGNAVYETILLPGQVSPVQHRQRKENGAYIHGDYSLLDQEIKHGEEEIELEYCRRKPVYHRAAYAIERGDAKEIADEFHEGDFPPPLTYIMSQGKEQEVHPEYGVYPLEPSPIELLERVLLIGETQSVAAEEHKNVHTYRTLGEREYDAQFRAAVNMVQHDEQYRYAIIHKAILVDTLPE